MFTQQDVKNAYFAAAIDEYAQANRCSVQSAILEAGIDEQDLPKELARYEAGKEILKRARLVFSQRFQRFTAEPEMPSHDGETILVPAGHIATHEAVRRVGLKTR